MTSNKAKKIEFHCHTSNSFDCEITINERLKSLINRNFNFVVITDHDETLSKKQLRYCKKNFPEIEVINGIEVSSSYGHIILINCNYRPIINSLWFIVLWSFVFSSEILIPHPIRKFTGLLDMHSRFGNSLRYINWFINKCDYYEIYNLRDTRKDKLIVNRKIYEKLIALKPVIGSDSHYLDDIYDPGNILGNYEIDQELIENFRNYFNFKNIRSSISYKEIWRTIKSNIKYSLRYIK